MEAIFVSARIHLDQVPRLDHPFGTGDAMHHFAVDTDADTGREIVIALKTRDSAHLPDPLFGVGV